MADRTTKASADRADCAQASAVLRDKNGHIWSASVNERVAVLLDKLAKGEVQIVEASVWREHVGREHVEP